jgi:hypothetical protein
MTKQKDSAAITKMVDRLLDIRGQITALNKEVEVLKADRDETEGKLIEMMDALGTDQVRNDHATASITERIVPQVEDWDRFSTFIFRNKALYMLERRPAATAYREMLEQRKGRAIPGVTSYTKRTIGLRSRSPS